MKSRVLGWLALGLSVVGLAASIASLIDTFGPTFCSESGCETVRSSAWAHPLGVPMPVFGIAYFTTMIAWSFSPRRRGGRVALAVAGGLWAAGLIALQAFVIGAWCKLCLVADPAAIVLAISIAAGASPIRFTWRRGAMLLPAGGAIIVAIALYAHARPPAVPAGTPDVVSREQVGGAVTVVEFVDFECPFCRAMQHTLAEAIGHRSVRVVRKMVPLPQHAHAMPAALAWCCADAQGKGDAMAAALFATDPTELTPDGCERIAARIGCDLERYHRDYPATIGRVAADMLDARGAGIRSLPTTFVGTERLVGAQFSPSELVTLLDRAEH